MQDDASGKLGKGYVHVYTGTSKGKTTAALGLAFRAMGHGLRTYMGQFMKDAPSGELEAARRVQPYIVLEQYGRSSPIGERRPGDAADIALARDGLAKLKRAMLSGDYNIIVCDEIITAEHFGILELGDVLNLISSKPDGVELVLTGRNASPVVTAAADLVTEMKEVKHYYSRGVPARRGIEV